jgi:hypothetical protein
VDKKDVTKLIDQSERIGVIGSPSSTAQLTLDILGTSVCKKLIGELALFRYLQDGRNHYSLGQITEVRLSNIWHEDPTMRSLIRQKGRVDPISERQDTHMGDMTISAVFSDGVDGYEPSILGTVPATGTPIHLVGDEILQALLDKYKEEMFYLGKVYGSTPKLPLWFKHFGKGRQGAGEAYHLGIFGKTGSGKSVLAKMILLAYARYSDMAIFVIDPQGEFSKDMKTGQALGEFQLPMIGVLKGLKKPHEVLGVRNLVLDRWNFFEEIIAGSDFFERLGMHTSDKRKLAAEVLREQLERERVTLNQLYTRDAFDAAWRILQDDHVLTQIYSGRERKAELLRMIQSTDANDHFNAYWLPVANLFQYRTGATSVDTLLRKVFDIQAGTARPIIVVDLSKESAGGLYWNDQIQALVINRLFDGIVLQAEKSYTEKNTSLNTLVIIDEARRLASREQGENEEADRIRKNLADAALTTRKYGLGWMFITQSPLNLHRDIVNQLRINFFGFGLAMGAEFNALKEIVGGDPNSLKLYRSFRDPHCAFDAVSRQYAFMTTGPVSPLSFAGTPLFLTAFNNPGEFLKVNNFTVS